MPRMSTNLLNEGEGQRGGGTDSSNSVEPFMRPSSVAVIGVSHDEDSLGTRLFRNILEGGFAGPVYGVNRNGGTVLSLPMYKSILDCPGPVDLALLLVPAAATGEVAEECGKKGVKGLTVITAGFAETGDEGLLRQRELMARCRKYGMRLMGPNCSGLVKLGTKLNAQFTQHKPLPGRVGFVSQSGALGAAVFEYANRLGLGLSAFVSVGNEADVSALDFIQFLKDDDDTDIIVLYIESLGNPKKLLEAARQITRKKPILVVKAGRSNTGIKAAHSHTGAILEGSDAVVEAVFDQAGIIRADTIEEMLDLAALLANQPVPRGNRVGIITNAGGPGILAADACEEFGLEVPPCSQEVQAALRSFLRPEASVRNPVDLLASSGLSDCVKAVGALAGDPGIDCLVVLSAPPLFFSLEDFSRGILAISEGMQRRIPVVTSFSGAFAASRLFSDEKAKIPSYPVPRMAVQTLSRAVAYGRWLSRPLDHPTAFPDAKRTEARGLVTDLLSRGRDWLAADEAKLLLDCYGVTTLETLKAATAKEAAQATSRLHADRVVLKGVAEGLIHKTEAGGVKVGLREPSDVRAAAEEMAEQLASAGYHPAGFLVQPMITSGLELIVGVKNDRAFGPIVICGSGGVLVELLNDVSTRVAPLTERDATEMIHSLKVYPLMKGYRGGPTYDEKALSEVVQRVAALATDIPEVAELDLNPIMLQPSGKGATVLDSRIRIEALN